MTPDERIAAALERIAHALEPSGRTVVHFMPSGRVQLRDGTGGFSSAHLVVDDDGFLRITS